ncbi:MAG: hypothetical protein LBK57_08865, partial [Clostridiales Family XIII bacterium]|nr:hypothetical protein [Clostridiales Family XIII bacterium]
PAGTPRTSALAELNATRYFERLNATVASGRGRVYNVNLAFWNFYRKKSQSSRHFAKWGVYFKHTYLYKTGESVGIKIDPE